MTDAAGATAARASLTVALTPSYLVHVGTGLLAHAHEFVSHRRIAIITDDNVGPLYAASLTERLTSAGRSVTTVSVRPGEDSKHIAVWGGLLSSLAQSGLGRDAAVIALGGGVVGDLAGFVAASYLRGVDFYQFPTSLLAMVDASVGGKTGLDLPEGKNLVGAFWQPKAVVIDVDTLRTLPEREFRQGTVELVKAGYLADASLTDVHLGDWSPLTDPARLADAVLRAVKVKVDIVAADEREAGLRAVLNLGHTLAHALETATDNRLQHGDAVAHGLVYAALLARARGWADLVTEFLRLRSWVAAAPLPRVPWETLVPFLERDKKAVGGKPRFVLLTGVGAPTIVDDVDEAELRRAWGALEELEEQRA